MQCRAGKINANIAAGDGDGNGNNDILGTGAIIIHEVAKTPNAVGYQCEFRPRQTLGITIKGLQRRAEGMVSAIINQSLQALHPDPVGAHLRLKITAELALPAALKLHQALHHFCLVFALHDQMHRRQQHALFIDMPRQRHGARGIGANIGVVSAIDSKPPQPTPSEKWRDKGDVGQVRAAQERIVEHHHITGTPVQVLDNIGHRIGHTTQMHGYMRRLRAELSVLIEYRAGIIQPILDIGGKRRVLQHRAHFVTNRLQATGKHAQFNGIDRRLRHTSPTPVCSSACSPA